MQGRRSNAALNELEKQRDMPSGIMSQSNSVETFVNQKSSWRMLSILKKEFH